MMHHPNMHHQAMSGHPPQHMGGHQTMPTHHQIPPHQLHRENRHVTLTRVPLGPSQAGGGMNTHGQPMGGISAMGVPQHHGPTQRPPHAIRAMPHHPPAQHHSIPPQQMKPLRRPYVPGGYGPSGGVMPGPFPQPRHITQSVQPVQTTTSSQQARLCRSSSPSRSIFSTPTKLSSDFAVSSTPNKTVTTNPDPANVPEASANANSGAGKVTTTGAGVVAANGENGGHDAASGDGEAARPIAAQANSKEKTPMCLVNELARYNKIKHQYRLTSETGPAHKKVFTVTLRLGDTEEYTAEGSSIKRAQHAAASSALAGTGYPPPPPRTLTQHPSVHSHHRHSVMPTVELNALAMKLCQPAVYTSIPAVASGRGVCAGRGYRGSFLPPPYPRMVGTGSAGLMYRVRVSVGGRAWLGEGPTPQAARHDAAARALRDLRPPPDPRARLALATAPAPAPAIHAETHADPPPAEPDTGETDLLNSEVKSPVSLVHELALKRNMSVQFTVKSERGPPHMRVFVTVCTVGELETEGDGNGKKLSKRRAAERMLEEMRRRWPPALLRARLAHDPRRRSHPAKKKPRNLVKEGGETGGGGGGGSPTEGSDNPISILAVARHAARARSPQYHLVEERGAARRREFIVQCDAPPHSATGLGPNKKLAKRRAAQNVLLSMEQSSGKPNGTVNSTNTNSDANSITAGGDSNKPNSNDKQKENDSENNDVRQPVPGVLLMDYHQRTQPPQHNGVPEAAAALGGSTHGAKDKLMYLSQLLGFTVQFSDFPKRNHGEYLSLVSLSTEPPVMVHGGGPSTAHSHEQCSRAALRALAMMGLDAPAPAPATASAPATAPAPAPAPQQPNTMQNITGSGTKSIITNGITE